MSGAGDELEMRIRTLEAERLRPVPRRHSAVKRALEARAVDLINELRCTYGPLHDNESDPEED